MNVEVINTGSELLLGFVTNTHVGYIAQQIAPLGLKISRQTTVPDGPDIGGIFLEAMGRSDIIFITGGLGPTSDDITRDIIADKLGRPLLRDERLMAWLDGFFLKRGLALAQMNYRQADYPEGAEILENQNGTAPGLYIQEQGKNIFLLPGPPRELHPMFETKVIPLLKSLIVREKLFHCRILRMTGIGESALAHQVEPALAALQGLEIGYCARIGEVDLRLISTEQGTVESAAQIARSIFNASIFSESNESLEDVVVSLARENGVKLASAESCTGGYIAHRLTNVPGSSHVFTGAIISYANEVKENLLSIDPGLLLKHGAVSEEVAIQMALNARKLLGADIAVSATGIAGPGGDTPDKPLGLVYIGISTDTLTRVWRCHYPLNRESFKQMVSQFALERIRRYLKGIELNS